MQVILNGKLMPASEAAVSVFDRAFAYGDALFETLKVLGGRPVFFEEHLRRLTRGMEEAGFGGLPDSEGLRRLCLELAAANAVDRGRLRLQVSRGAPGPGQPVGFDPAPGLRPTVLVTCEEFPGYPEAMYREGIDCITVPLSRGAHAHLKSTGMLPLVLARQEMRAAGAGEALLTGNNGSLLEGTFTNIFLARAGRLATPPDAAPILPGVIRGKVIGIAADMGIPVDYRVLSLDEASAGATAAFLTSSLLGIGPVKSIDGIALELGTELAGAISKRLAELETQDAES